MVGAAYPTAVIFRSTVFSKINALTLCATAVIVGLTAGIPVLVTPGLRNNPWSAAGVALLKGCFLILAFLFARMEVTFDGRAVTLAFAFIKKRLPLENITALEAGKVTFWEGGGTGIHYSPGRAAWLAGPGPIVKITAGKTVYWASCQNAERLVALVEQYRASAPRG